MRLDDVVLHHRLARAAAGLFPRQGQERVHRAPGDTKCDAAEPDRIELVAGETIQRAVGPAVARIVAIDGALVRNEQIVDGILVAGRAAQSQCVPDIVECGARFGIQEGLGFLGARHPQMRTKPGGVLTAAHEAPFAGDAVPAFDRCGLVWRTGRSPGDDPVRPPENLLGNVRIEIRARGRAAVALTHHPPGRSIRGGDRLGHLGEDRGFQLHSADGFRLQHGEEPAIDQGFDDWFGEFPDFVVFVRGRGDQGHEIASLLDLRMDGRHGVSPAPRKRGPDRLPTGRTPWSSDGHTGRWVSLEVRSGSAAAAHAGCPSNRRSGGERT